MPCVVSKVTVLLVFSWCFDRDFLECQSQKRKKEEKVKTKQFSQPLQFSSVLGQTVKSWSGCLQLCLSLHFLLEVGTETSQKWKLSVLSGLF